MPEAAVTSPTQTPPPPAAVEPSTAIDLEVYRKNGRKEAPAAEPKPVEAKPAVEDADDDVDDETAKEIDAIEKPAENETRESRAARRRKHRKAAEKARLTRATNKLTAAEQELAEWREGRKTHTPPATGATPAKADAPTSDHTRPKPTVKDFPLEKFKDDDDPYAAQGAALAEAVADWKIDQRDHAAEQKRREAAAKADDEALEKTLDESEDAARGLYADYDAVMATARFNRTPASEFVRATIARSGYFGELRYRLAKNPARMNEILALPSPHAVTFALGEEIAAIKAERAGKKDQPTHPKVTAVTEPVQPVTAGAGTGAILRNPYQEPGTSINLDEARAWRRANAGR